MTISEDDATVIVPVIMSHAWDRAVAKGVSLGWLDEEAAEDLRNHNPYRD